MSDELKKVKLPPALAVLKKARAALKKGWTQGAWDDDGKVCVQGAISKGYGAKTGTSTVTVGFRTVKPYYGGESYTMDEDIDVDETSAGRILLETLTKDQLVRVIADDDGIEPDDEEMKELRRMSVKELRGRVSLPNWNDSKTTKKAEVLATVDRAIKRLEQKRKADANRRR